MRLGFGLPQLGPLAGADALVAVARRAEQLGYASLWVIDRLLHPVAPRAPYPAAADGKLPDASKTVFDPLATLAFIAAHTRRTALGTSVLVLPLYQPALLARQLTTIDVLSNGRLKLGVGTGWMPEEYEAAGVPMRERGARADEALAALKAFWTENPVAVDGRFFHVAPSVVNLRPVQQPHPPIYIAAFTPQAMRRVARDADGWMPAGVPVDGMRQMFGSIRDMAAAAGRDPQCIELVVRANLWISARPLGEARPIFAGSIEQVRADIDATRALGAHEVLFDAGFTPQVGAVGDLVACAEQLWELAHR
jgi:probable F420-dependent oxidoreductase